MANCDTPGQDRVRAKERNNRNTSTAKGMNTRTPRKMGATKGFGSNKRQGGGIFRGLKSSKNSSMGS